MVQAVREYREDRLAWAHSDIFNAGLDPFTGWVYLYLASRADSTGKSWPKQETIAIDCGISDRQVRRCVEKLIEAKLLVVLETSGRAGGRRSIYYLSTRNEWVGQQVAKLDQPDCESGSQGATDEMQAANRTESPVQPDCESGSLYRGIKSNELVPTKAAQAPVLVPDVPSKGKGKTPKKAPDPRSFLLLFAPDEFRQDDAFVEAWNGWGQNRIEAKNPLNERAAKIALGKLTKFPLKVAIEALERSTMNCWTGVFPESIASGGRAGKFSEASGDQPKQDFGW